MKCGMLPGWDVHGMRVPLTVLEVQNAQVVQARTPDVDGYSALQIGVGHMKPSRVKSSLRGQCAKAGVEPKRKLVEFRVAEENMLPLGACFFLPSSREEAWHPSHPTPADCASLLCLSCPCSFCFAVLSLGDIRE